MEKNGLPVENPGHYVDGDVYLFNKTFEEIKKKMNEVKNSNSRYNLDEILDKKPLLKEFQKLYEDVKYLTDLNDKDKHENFFYKIY